MVDNHSCERLWRVCKLEEGSQCLYAGYIVEIWDPQTSIPDWEVEEGVCDCSRRGLSSRYSYDTVVGNCVNRFGYVEEWDGKARTGELCVLDADLQRCQVLVAAIDIGGKAGLHVA
ncbi:hypothetical protein TTRE_0000934801 [Trichuris trichiura]|uniref:Uncharacterized protein n=1 Tax=Trichuris trichiura TaxID=36087 RepID=A0A077ZKR0_TRITR|nr:hypothetical protein TTRE_0000934801 [Trichuris trichiura]